MKIGLYNLEPKIENTAMMKVSMYHKLRGDQVEIYNPFFKNTYDKIYAFSIFDFTDKGYVTKDMICGGTGFDVKSKLQAEIESCDYDYSIFPKCKSSYVWFSRGCIRKCPFCIVSQKDGIIHPVELKNLNPAADHIEIMDDNFFANCKYPEAIDRIIKWNKPVNFMCGIDVRLFNDKQGNLLKKLKFYKQLNIAWDDPKDDLRPQIRHLMQYIKAYK